MSNPYNCSSPGGISTHRSTTSPPPVLLLLEILLLGRTPGQNNPHSSLASNTPKSKVFSSPQLSLARPQHAAVSCTPTSHFSAFEAIIKKNI